MTFLATICPDCKTDRVEHALKAMQAAESGAPIYNVDYKEAKYALDRAVDKAWDAQVRNPFLAGKGFETAESDFDRYLGSVSNLNDVIARAKKLAKLKAATKLSKYSDRTFGDVDPAMAEVVTAILSAALPVALLVKDLKGEVVKGRKPNAPSELTKAARVKEAAKRTCPCCFRKMALTSDGSVTRHGWEEAGGRRVGQYGNTWHQGQCHGVGFRPWEVSSAGTRSYLALVSDVWVAQTAANLAKLQARPATITVVYQDGGYGSKTKSVELADDSVALDDHAATYSYSRVPDSYAYELNQRISRVKSELKQLRDLEKFLQGKLDSRTDGKDR
jgi:hypothetical protein